ncbi:carbohydrate kinase [Nadsonia fulvescens var. elongata DSM 6958]|uniref:Gluconokinase n=1 Tax=Nadsonia fulvescens var. elongata DSM 6958 TaxID=857566 RepID=A0A1E3PLQ4_9ASCO|nr:carbohydrate kinase [Nadsonia fulvescens var. elongata DSM 6958]
MTISHPSLISSSKGLESIANAKSPTIVIVGGPAGTGKTTVGEMLTASLNSAYIEGDQLHPEDNIKKMASGIPLTDDDRWGWLKTVAETSHKLCVKAAAKVNNDESDSSIYCVASCSALKKVYRETILDKIQEINSQSEIKARVFFVFLYADKQVLIARTSARKHHFMASTMVNSQFEIMQVPEGSELLEEGGNSLTVDTEGKSPEKITVEILERLHARSI